MRNRRLTWQTLPGIAVLALLQIGGTAQASTSLTPHFAEYKIKISVLGGRLRTNLQSTESGYRAESSIKATGMSRILARGEIRESSVFVSGDDGLQPQHFLSADSLSKKGQIVDLEFDWNTLEVDGTIDGADFETSLDGVVHDRVSLQYGLMHDLLNGIEREQYSLQDAERLKELSISNIGNKSVKVPYGRFEAIGIQHQAAGSSRVTTLWCVKSLGYLPVIIEQHRKGKLRVRAVLTEYSAAD